MQVCENAIHISFESLPYWVHLKSVTKINSIVTWEIFSHSLRGMVFWHYTLELFLLLRRIPHYKITTIFAGDLPLAARFSVLQHFFSSLTECASLVCTSSLWHWFWWARALAYFPFQSHPWLWHSTASSLVIWSMALLKEIVDAWNSLRRIGHFRFDVDLVSCLRETRHPEWPQLKLMGFKHGIETVWDGKETDQNGIHGYPKQNSTNSFLN